MNLGLVLALGLRHGLDADHLAAIDGLSRLRPSVWNGVLFALGHGGVVTLLAVGASRIVGGLDLGFLTPWLLLGIAAANAARLLRPRAHAHPRLPLRFGPLLLGVLLAVGFETSSQIAALSLSTRIPPLVLGLAFTCGLLCSDGLNGWLAARVQLGCRPRSQVAAVVLGWTVVGVSLALALADLAGRDLADLSLPVGLGLLALLVALRLWSLGGTATHITSSNPEATHDHR